MNNVYNAFILTSSTSLIFDPAGGEGEHRGYGAAAEHPSGQRAPGARTGASAQQI